MAKHAVYNPANLQDTVRQLYGGQPDIITVTTPATTLTELRIGHGLGRIPKGWSVISGDPVGGGSTAYTPAGTVALTPSNVATTIVYRVCLFYNFVSLTSMGTTGTLYRGPSNNTSWKAIRSGNITGMSFHLTPSAVGSSNTTMTATAKVNGSSALAVTSAAITSLAQLRTTGTSAAINTYPFAAGDLLSVDWTFNYTGTRADCTDCGLDIELSVDESATTGYTYTAAFTGTPGTVGLVKGVVVGPTAWTETDIYLKFVATSVPITLAVW